VWGYRRRMLFDHYPACPFIRSRLRSSFVNDLTDNGHVSTHRDLVPGPIGASPAGGWIGGKDRDCVQELRSCNRGE